MKTLATVFIVIGLIQVTVAIIQLIIGLKQLRLKHTLVESVKNA